MKIEVKNLSNQSVGEAELSDEVFGYPYKEHLIHLAVVSYRAAQRSGSHKTKGRGEVAGSTKKPYRQKGTGRARAGAVTSPLWRKGGVVHGPKPRSHANKLTAGEKRNALKSALSRKLADSEVIVLDSLDLDSHKTQALDQAISGLGASGKTLLVDDYNNRNLALASRNNQRLKPVDALALNVYDVVDRNHVVVSKAALERIAAFLSK